METTCLPGISYGDVLDEIRVDMIKYRQDEWFGIFMPALRTFHSLVGHTDVPEEFVVPHSSPPWPPATWGLHLGQSIKRSNDTKQLYATQVAASYQELKKMGFTWTVTTAADRSWKYQVLPALKVFYQEHGHFKIESKFVVPKWAPWPKDAWGLNLGAIVKRVRAGSSYVDQVRQDRDTLEKLTFLRDPRDVEWQDFILPALATFANEYRDNQQMTSDFVVPSTAPWPKQTWGFELGRFMSDSQRRDQYFVQIIQDAHVLDRLGFEIHLSDSMWEQQVVPLLKIFSAIFPNQSTLPKDFVVPHQQPWPKKMWGLKLGRIGTRNANRMALLENKWKERSESTEQLPLDLGQLWKMRVFPALVTFVEVFGDCRLGRNFAVPSGDPWPKQTWGLRLGATIASYMENGTCFKQIGRDADRLDVLGFSFKLSTAPWELYGVPLLETFSMVHPCTVVPHNFVVPAEAPWQDTMWGIKLGKIVRWNSQHIANIESEWRMQVLTALDVYRTETGIESIGEKFGIPSQPPWPMRTWGMDLARIVHRLHVGVCYDGHVALAKTSIYRRKHLLNRRRCEAWESIFKALKTFSKSFGHCNVKPQFVIPARIPWPRSVWNFQLGQIVEKMKKTGIFFSYVGRCANRLNKLGFTLTLSNAAWEKMVAPLIATFAKLYPRDTIPVEVGEGFTIPSTEPWPESDWGVNLGVIVQWNLNRLKTIERSWVKQVLQANEVYQFENGNKVLRDKFVVPSRSPWPYKTWGRELRHILTRIQVGQHYGGHTALVDMPTVELPDQNSHSSEVCVDSSDEKKEWKTFVFPALHTFAMVFGHCSISEGFTVPSESPWPKHIFGLPLGRIVSDMEKRGAYFAEVGLSGDRLATFGFGYKLADAPWKEHVAPLLETFATQFPHKVLPEDFVVPPKKCWPEKLWGLHLGRIVSWSSRFYWNNKLTQWKEHKMPENTSLAGAYGYCKVSPSFKVPCELPWPKKMWGLPMTFYLGEMNQSADLFLSGGLRGAMMSEQEFGFVFKLETMREPEGRPDVEQIGATAESTQPDVEQIDASAESPRPKESESCLDKRPRADASKTRKEGWIGDYSPKSRKARVEKFLKKREQRVWVKQVKYDVRKTFADKRLRVRGRFVTREEQVEMQKLISLT